MDYNTIITIAVNGNASAKQYGKLSMFSFQIYFIQNFGNSALYIFWKLILLFSKDALNWSKMSKYFL